MKVEVDYKLNISGVKHFFGGFYLKSLGMINRSSQWYIFNEPKLYFSLCYKDISWIRLLPICW